MDLQHGVPFMNPCIIRASVGNFSVPYFWLMFADCFSAGSTFMSEFNLYSGDIRQLFFYSNFLSYRL